MSKHRNAAQSGFASQMIGACLPDYPPGHARLAHFGVKRLAPDDVPIAPVARLQKTARAADRRSS